MFYLLSSFEVKLGISQLNFAVSKFCYLDKYSWILFTYSSSGKVQAVFLDKFCKCRKLQKAKTVICCYCEDSDCKSGCK